MTMIWVFRELVRWCIGGVMAWWIRVMELALELGWAKGFFLVLVLEGEGWLKSMVWVTVEKKRGDESVRFRCKNFLEDQKKNNGREE